LQLKNKAKQDPFEELSFWKFRIEKKTSLLPSWILFKKFTVGKNLHLTF
jgi:hypothetical protein